jgi:hypothetical protein
VTGKSFLKKSLYVQICINIYYIYVHLYYGVDFNTTDKVKAKLIDKWESEDVKVYHE